MALTYPTTAMSQATVLINGALSNLRAVVGGSPTSIINSSNPNFSLSVDLTGAGIAAPQELQAHFSIEGLGAAAEFNADSPFVNAANYVGLNTLTAAAIPTPPVGVYRISALVRSRMQPAPGGSPGSGAVMLTGFIEGLVIEVTA
jgi:hypothetical protein